MMHLFEEQSRHKKSSEGKNIHARKKNSEYIVIENKQGNVRRIPFEDDPLRGDLQKHLANYNIKKCKDTLGICEDALGKELGQQKTDSQRDTKLRQLLWETSPELKELRKMMLTADVARDQAMQLAEKQALAELGKQEEESLAAAAEEEKKKLENERKRIEQMEHQAKLQYHKDLDDLRKFRVSKQEVDKDQLLKDKAAIDEIRRQIDEEDLEREQKRIEAQQELHRQALELQKVRQEMKLQERQKELEMEAREDKFRTAQDLRSQQQVEERQLTMEQRLQLQEELLACLESMYAEKADRQLLWTELGIEEKEAAESKKEKTGAMQRKQVKEELQRLYDMQMYVKKQKEELQKKEEELLRQNLMTKLFEEEKLEHMSQQKRRLKQVEHRRIARELIEENRKKKAIECARDVADHQYLQQLESDRLKLVNEERRKFLSEHARELLGYLPKGIFKDSQEIERLGEDFKQFYSKRNCSYLFQE